MSRNTTKPEKLGMEKLAVVFAVLLFLFQLVLGTFGVQSFLLGVLFEIGILILLVYALWVWEGTHGTKVIWKMASSVVIVVLIIGMLWRPARNQYRREHPPQSVLTMQAQITGSYGPNTPITRVDLELQNPPEDAIQNVDLMLTMIRNNKSNSPFIRKISKPLERDDCKAEAVDTWPEMREEFKGADGKGGAIFSSRELSDGYIGRHGSAKWELKCLRVRGGAALRFELEVLGDAERNLLQIDGTYELIPSKGSAVVKVSKTVVIAK